MELKNLKKTIRKTAELLSEAYGIDEDFVLEVLTDTFTVPKSKVPHRKIVDGESLLPSELDFYFQPNIYTALRDLPVKEVTALFADKDKRAKLKKIENDFSDLKDNCPLSPFDYIADCVPDFRRHLYYERRKLRLGGNTSKAFTDCGILDQYFSNRMYPMNFALPRRFDRDSEHGRQSLYSKICSDYRQENPLPGETFGYKKLSDGTVEFYSSSEIIPAQSPHEPKLPFGIKELFCIKKERYGELWTSFRFKHFHTNPDDIDFTKFDRDQFLSQIIAFREFINRPDVLEKEKRLRHCLNNFVRSVATNFKNRFLNVGIKNNLQRDILKKLRSHPLNEFADTLLSDNFQLWDLPKSLPARAIFFWDDRLKKIFKLAMILDLESETQAISSIQGIFKSVIIEKYYSENGGYNYFKTSLYRAMEDMRSTSEKKVSINECLEKIESATKIYDQHKNVFEFDFKQIDSAFLRKVENYIPDLGYEFGDGFRSFKNYNKNIEIMFSKQQAKVVEMLVTNDNTKLENSLGTYKIIETLYSQKNAAEKIRRINSDAPFRVETEIFSINHDAITKGLIRRGYSNRTSASRRKERTYFIDPLFVFPEELPPQFNLKAWNKKYSQNHKANPEEQIDGSTQGKIKNKYKKSKKQLGRVLPRKSRKK